MPEGKIKKALLDDDAAATRKWNGRMNKNLLPAIIHVENILSFFFLNFTLHTHKKPVIMFSVALPLRKIDEFCECLLIYFFYSSPQFSSSLSRVIEKYLRKLHHSHEVSLTIFHSYNHKTSQLLKAPLNECINHLIA